MQADAGSAGDAVAVARCSRRCRWTRGLSVDASVVYTDGETWAGEIHPVQALRRHRERTGIAAKPVAVGMVSNGFSIAGPDDAGMLDVVGFDAAAPAVIAASIRR